MLIGIITINYEQIYRRNMSSEIIWEQMSGILLQSWNKTPRNRSNGHDKMVVFP